MLKTIASLIFLLAGLVIFGMVVRIIGFSDIAKSFLLFSPWGIISLLVFSIVAHFVGAIKWQYILRTMGVRIRVFDLFRVVLIGNAISYITPIAYIGGEVFRGYVLKERYNVPWQKSLSSIGIDKIAEASVWAGAICIGIILYVTQTGILSFSKIVVVRALSAFFLSAGWWLSIFLVSKERVSYTRLS